MIAFLLILAGWIVLSAVVGPIVGRTIHLADEQSEAERAAAMQRHPSGRAR